MSPHLRVISVAFIASPLLMENLKKKFLRKRGLISLNSHNMKRKNSNKMAVKKKFKKKNSLNKKRCLMNTWFNC